MKYNYILAILFCFSFTFAAEAQMKPIVTKPAKTIDKSNITIQSRNRRSVPANRMDIMTQPQFEVRTLPFLVQSDETLRHLEIKRDLENGLPTFIYGNLPQKDGNATDTKSRCLQHLEALQPILDIEDAKAEFFIKRESTDEQGLTHVRMQQYWNGIKVYNGELIVHLNTDGVYLVNGRYFPTPELTKTTTSINEAQAMNIVQNDLPDFRVLSVSEKFLIANQEQLSAELVVYHKDAKTSNSALAWHVTAFPHPTQRWEYFVDAQSGTVIHNFNNICQIHGGRCSHADHQTTETKAPIETVNNDLDLNMPGPVTANALDLNNDTQTINVWEEGGAFYMIDGSRDMFNNGQSNMPNEPIGAVWTIDAFNTAPQNDNFNYDHVSSSNNTWTDKTAVSAHHNGGLAYEYFESTFNRNSINGSGGNIVSLINVSDANGNDMDNAFWNGAAMFYGNGDQAFNAPLAKGLDVAGHEMSHGVIQNTANLEYQKQSGAMNESFADIFGAMIDRDDWLVGEDIVNTSFFPSGAMRDLSNPHNGGSSLSQSYWQPDHMDEYQNLPNTPQGDNGGVHINSGIVNHAYYLFATTSSVGKDKAERVYYKALNDYLTASSQFVDLRNAVVQASTDLYDNTVVAAAQNAFSQVGIGEGAGTADPEDVPTNNGDEFVLLSNENTNQILVSTIDPINKQPISNSGHISKPSITDDGSIILYVADDNTMWEIDIDWDTGDVDSYVIQDSPIWRNVATSKDGSKLAALTTDFDNQVYVFDFDSGNDAWFSLYNPTFTQGVSTGDVLYPDVLEWDFSGSNIMYDAANEISGISGDIQYWDIGFIDVWDNNANDFDDGSISKLFSGLPENVSIGNPTFSKNSPYIIAFDVIDSSNGTDAYSVNGVDLEFGNQGVIFEGNTLGYPNYSVNDDQLIFTFIQDGGEIIGVRGLQSDKVTGTGDAFLLTDDTHWATWFATGERDLNIPTTEVNSMEEAVNVYPNPVTDICYLNIEVAKAVDAQIQVFDLLGQMVYQTALDLNSGLNQEKIDLGHLPTGTYLINTQLGDDFVVKKVIKN